MKLLSLFLDFNSNRKKIFSIYFHFHLLLTFYTSNTKTGTKIPKNFLGETKIHAHTPKRKKNKNENKNENKTQQIYGTNGGKWTWTNLRPIIFLWL